MDSLATVILLGFFLGMRHASDPDHVIAVTNIVSQCRRVTHGALIGILWGSGHTLTILLVGSAMILFGVVIPPRIGLSMELCVALMLIILGILSLSGIIQPRNQVPTKTGELHNLSHSHHHSHGDYVHSHLHSHAPGTHGHEEEETPLSWLARTFGEMGLFQLLRPILVGIVHGLAGSAAVTLLVLTTIRRPQWAIAYLLVFGFGTIVGMMVITATISVPIAYGGNNFGRFQRYLRISSGLVSFIFGIVLGYQIGFVSGLFTSHSQWTPH